MTFDIKIMVDHPSGGQLEEENDAKVDYLVHDNCLQMFKKHWRKRALTVLHEKQKASRTSRGGRDFSSGEGKTFLRVK